MHKRRHDIDHETNEMWIDEVDGRRHHLIGRRPETTARTERANELGLATITWREARQLQHRHGGKVKFYLAKPSLVAEEGNEDNICDG